VRRILIFEEERIAIDIEEIAKVEAVEPGERQTLNRFGDRDPQDAQTRVTTKSSGFFYTSLPFEEVMERITTFRPAPHPLSGDTRG
jgi:hypothetical protein